MEKRRVGEMETHIGREIQGWRKGEWERCRYGEIER
jgi:hypothetical protein